MKKCGFEPLVNENSRILILGTIPSIESMRKQERYGHKSNQFWKILFTLFEKPFPDNYEEKNALLTESNIAIWDVLHSCDIQGSDDGSIKNPVPNDLDRLYRTTAIQTTFTTGSKATALYKRFFHQDPIALPSTSPANCRFYNYEKLKQAYGIILEYLS